MILMTRNSKNYNLKTEIFLQTGTVQYMHAMALDASVRHFKVAGDASSHP